MDDDADTSGGLVSLLAGLDGLSGGLSGAIAGGPAAVPAAVAAPPAAPAAAPPAAPAAAPGTLGNLSDVPPALAALYQQQQQNTKNAYDQQAAALQAARKAQNGLSAADLFKLSGAMLTPTRGGSFAAALGNTLPVAGDIATAHAAADKDYPAQMMALNQKYAADQLANTSGYLSSVTPTLKALNTAHEAANKAAQPKVIAVPQGGTLVAYDPTTGSQTSGGGTPNGAVSSVITPAHIDYLRSHPETADIFDKRFGAPGLASYLLGKGN